MDPQVNIYKTAFSQRGNGFNFLVLMGTYKYKYGQSLNDVHFNIVQFIPRDAQFLKFVAIKSVQTFVKAGSKAMIDNASV